MKGRSTIPTPHRARAKKALKRGVYLGNMQKQKQATFLQEFAKSGNILHAARQAGIDRTTHYDWLKKPEYAARYAVAEADALEVLEGEAIRRGLVGYDEPVFGKLPGHETGTGQVGVVRKFSDNLLMFVLRARAPERYRENLKHELTGPQGGPVQITFNCSSPPWAPSGKGNGHAPKE